MRAWLRPGSEKTRVRCHHTVALIIAFLLHVRICWQYSGGEKETVLFYIRGGGRRNTAQRHHQRNIECLSSSRSSMHFAPALDRMCQTCIFLQGHTSAANRGFEPVQALASGVAIDFVTGRGGRGGVNGVIACIYCYHKTYSAGYRDGGSAMHIPSGVLNNSMVAVFAIQEDEEMQDCGRGDTFRFTSEFGPLEPE